VTESDARPILTADAAGLIGCRTCGRVWPMDHNRCERCGERLSPPRTKSLNTVWAWLLAGFVFYIPANLYPMLRTDMFLYGSQATTILEGVVEFLAYGDVFVALVILVASVLIPISKFMAIGYLAWTVTYGRAAGHRQMILYEVVEFIGRWSMVDVFVVAILSALVQLGFVVSIHPGPAAAAFALSVAFTMLAAQSFDPRLVWRRRPQQPSAAPDHAISTEHS
jgi:paraquat-inducible protein A